MNRPAALAALLLALALIAGPASGQNSVDSYAPATLKVNWGNLVEELLVDKLYSHGCLHVSPQIVRILYDIVPPGTEVEIKEYGENPPEGSAKIPHLLSCVVSAGSLAQAQKAFARPGNLKLTAYPGPGLLILSYKGQPYAWAGFRPGFPQTSQMYMGHANGQPVFDKYYLTRTVPGLYWMSYYTDYLQASYYPLTTSLPYGARLLRAKSGWVYRTKDQERAVPREIEQDLNRPAEERQFEYFEEKKDQNGQLTSVRWGNHDYGVYVLGFSDANGVLNQDLIYAPGLLINIQRKIVHDLVSLITSASADLVKLAQVLPDRRRDLLFYNYANNPTASQYIRKTQKEKEYYAYYKLYRGLSLDGAERKLVLPLFFAALTYLNKGPGYLTKEETKSLVDLGAAVRQDDKVIYDEKKIRGIYYNLAEIGNQVETGARRWAALKQNWPILLAYRRQVQERYGKDDPKLGKYVLDDINRRLNFENLN